MYTTIEADIENGIILSPEASSIPEHAHVLITLLSLPQKANRLSATKLNVTTDPIRCPHPRIRGKTKVLGNIMDTVQSSSWDLSL